MNSTRLTATITAADISVAGDYPVAVYNPAPSGGLSSAVDFSVITPNPLPVLTNVSPTSTIVGGATFTITVTGTNFINGSVIRWNGVDRITTYVDSGHLTATIPSYLVSTIGTATIIVFNPAPGGGQSNGLIFNIAQEIFKVFLPNLNK